MDEGGKIVYKPFCRVIAVVVLSVAALLLALPAGASAQSQGDTLRTPGTAQSEAGWGQMSPQERQRAIEYSDTKNILYFISVGFIGLYGANLAMQGKC